MADNEPAEGDAPAEDVPEEDQEADEAKGEDEDVKSLSPEETEKMTEPPENTMVDALGGIATDVDACTGECVADGERVAAVCLDDLQERALLEAREATGSQLALKIIDRLLDAATGAKNLDSDLSVLPETESQILHALLDAEHQAYIKSNTIDDLKDAIKEYWRARDADPKRKDEDVPKEIQWKQHILVSRLGEFDTIARRVHRLISLSEKDYSAHDFLPRLREHSIALAAGKSLAELRDMREDYTYEKELQHVCCPYCTVEEQIPKIVVCGPTDHMPMVIMCDPVKKKIGKPPDCNEMTCAGGGTGTGSVQVSRAGERINKECPRFHGPEDVASLAGANMLLDQVNYLADEVKKLRIENLKISYQLNSMNMFDEPMPGFLGAMGGGSGGMGKVCPGVDPKYIAGLCPNGPRQDDECPTPESYAESVFPQIPKSPEKGIYQTPMVNICVCPQNDSPDVFNTLSEEEYNTCPSKRPCPLEKTGPAAAEVFQPCPLSAKTPGTEPFYSVDYFSSPMRLGGGAGGSQRPCVRPDVSNILPKQDMGQPKIDTCLMTRRSRPKQQSFASPASIVRPCPELDPQLCRIPTISCPLMTPPPCGLTMTPCPNVERPPCHQPVWPPSVPSYKPKKKLWPPTVPPKKKVCSGPTKKAVPALKDHIDEPCPCPPINVDDYPLFTIPSHRNPEQRECPACLEDPGVDWSPVPNDECACMMSDPGTLPIIPSRDPKQRRLYGKRCVCPPVPGSAIPCGCGCIRTTYEHECPYFLYPTPAWAQEENRTGPCANAAGTPCSGFTIPSSGGPFGPCEEMGFGSFGNGSNDTLNRLERQLGHMREEVHAMQQELVHVDQIDKDLMFSASIRPQPCNTPKFAADCNICNR